MTARLADRLPPLWTLSATRPVLTSPSGAAFRVPHDRADAARFAGHFCCGSRDETTLVDAVYSALREVFSRYGADIDPTTEIATGTTAMDPDALAPAVSP